MIHKTKKVLIVSHSSTLNGAERALKETLNALCLYGYELYAIFPQEGPIIEKCIPYIKAYSIIPEPWWLDRGIRLSFMQKIKRLMAVIKYSRKNYLHIKLIKPDIVITNTVCIPCTSISCKFAKKKHIWYLHEMGDEDHNFNYIFGKKISLLLVNLLSKKVVFNSLFLEARLSRFIQKNKRIVLYQPVEIEHYSKSQFIENNEKTLKLILIGRFAEGKGQLEAVKAVNIIKQKGEEVKLLLVGSNNDSYSLLVRKYVEDNGLREVVTIEGFIENVVPFYKNSNIALVCSRSEAFGRITIESMKMGLPVVASNTGANPDLVKDGFNGYLYKYGNAEDLADKILLLKDENDRNKMSEHAKKWANENYNMNKYAYDLYNEIESLL